MNRNERRRAEKLSKQNAGNSARPEQQLLQQAQRYYQRGQYEEAKVVYQQVLSINPLQPDAFHYLGLIASQAGQNDIAEKLLSHALKITPDNVDLYINLGNVYKELERFEEAEEAFQHAKTINPDLPLLYFNLGGLYLAQHRLDLAESALLKTVELDPNFIFAHLNLGIVCLGQARVEEATRHIKHVLSISDGNPLVQSAAYSIYLFIMHYDARATPQDIYHETLKWAAKYADTTSWLEHKNDPDPKRRLRIGYVSADFYKHAVAAYIEPVLRSHDKSEVEIFCYANQSQHDDVTVRLHPYADQWRNIYGHSHEEVARVIQEDKIDILIDLSGHSTGNRLPLFAYKPAPIQATWIGYFNTTGMKAMDYIITDRFLLPPEEEHLYTEKPLRLPTSGAVYSIPQLPIEVNTLPALTNGYVTFGCFNALPKLTPEVMELWGKILQQVPTAKLLLKNKAFHDKQVCEDYRARFKAMGVDEERLILAGYTPIAEYLKSYNNVDLGLDPFPYNGATTTLDSLWMGVPIVALKGDRLVSHIGESLLGAVGLEEFIAATKEEYVAKAVAFANDIPKLAEVRKNLRPTLTASPMTNPVLFTRGLEAALRDIWREWCKTRTQ